LSRARANSATDPPLYRLVGAQWSRPRARRLCSAECSSQPTTPSGVPLKQNPSEPVRRCWLCRRSPTRTTKSSGSANGSLAAREHQRATEHIAPGHPHAALVIPAAVQLYMLAASGQFGGLTAGLDSPERHTCVRNGIHQVSTGAKPSMDVARGPQMGPQVSRKPHRKANLNRSPRSKTPRKTGVFSCPERAGDPRDSAFVSVSIPPKAACLQGFVASTLFDEFGAVCGG
jgi:hypothetical protein